MAQEIDLIGKILEVSFSRDIESFVIGVWNCIFSSLLECG